MYEKLGIRVDKVVQGKGKSNTRNVGPIFFENYVESAKITGVDVEVIRRLRISSGYQVNTTSFSEYAKETAELCISKYGWYYMPCH